MAIWQTGHRIKYTNNTYCYCVHSKVSILRMFDGFLFTFCRHRMACSVLSGKSCEARQLNTDFNRESINKMRQYLLISTLHELNSKGTKGEHLLAPASLHDVLSLFFSFSLPLSFDRNNAFTKSTGYHHFDSKRVIPGAKRIYIR